MVVDAGGRDICPSRNPGIRAHSREHTWGVFFGSGEDYRWIQFESICCSNVRDCK